MYKKKSERKSASHYHECKALGFSQHEIPVLHVDRKKGTYYDKVSPGQVFLHVYILLSLSPFKELFNLSVVRHDLKGNSLARGRMPESEAVGHKAYGPGTKAL